MANEVSVLEESKLKGKWVWAVVGVDPRSDDPAYLAYVQLFADREEARKCLRQSAKEDAECFEDKVEWHKRDTDIESCEIYCGGEPRVVYSLEAIKIK